ncbi:MAG: cytidylate kinase-like family protein, partial [Eubacteriales bacterium]|nr:cytidylate kinase-like family protein [Eubacteriales bacterium]
KFSFKGLLWAQPIADGVPLALGLVLLVVILRKCIKSSDTTAEAAAAPSVPGLVITISRQYGSGGREIGERLAAALGIPYYDKKLIDITAKQSGLDSELITGTEESVPKGVSYSQITGAYYAGSIFAYDGTPESDTIFTAQSAVIHSLAQQGSCVIVGRCADDVLAKSTSLFNVFVKANMADRVQRVVEQYGVAQGDAAGAINCVDKVRANYYRHYTGKSWGVLENYDLVVDSGVLGIDGCVSLLLEAIKNRS